MIYLVKTTEQYRCDSEEESKQLIEDAKKNNNFVLVKYNSEIKVTKSKGEIIDSWYRVILTKGFTSEKEPEEQVRVSYNIAGYDDEG